MEIIEVVVLERTIIHHQRIPVKKTLANHVYFNGSAKQAADYQTTTDYILNYITKTFEFGSDIALALKHHKPYGMDKHKPKLQSTKAKKDEEK
jgi:hypothetical protein